MIISRITINFLNIFLLSSGHCYKVLNPTFTILNVTLMNISQPLSISAAATMLSSPESSLMMLRTTLGAQLWLRREKIWNTAVLLPSSSIFIPLVLRILMNCKHSWLAIWSSIQTHLNFKETPHHWVFQLYWQHHSYDADAFVFLKFLIF